MSPKKDDVPKVIWDIIFVIYIEQTEPFGPNPICREARPLLFQLHDRDAGTAELYMLIVEMLDEWQGAKILTHKGAEYAVSGTMQYP